MRLKLKRKCPSPGYCWVNNHNQSPYRLQQNHNQMMIATNEVCFDCSLQLTHAIFSPDAWPEKLVSMQKQNWSNYELQRAQCLISHRPALHSHCNNDMKKTHRNKSGSQNHVDCCWFDEYDNGIESRGVQPLDRIATNIQYTMLALQTTHHTTPHPNINSLPWVVDTELSTLPHTLKWEPRRHHDNSSISKWSAWSTSWQPATMINLV